MAGRPCLGDPGPLRGGGERPGGGHPRARPCARPGLPPAGELSRQGVRRCAPLAQQRKPALGRTSGVCTTRWRHRARRTAGRTGPHRLLPLLAHAHGCLRGGLRRGHGPRGGARHAAAPGPDWTGRAARPSRTRSHRILPVPACPSCGDKDPVRPQPRLAELAVPTQASRDCLRAAPSLVSRLCGVVTSLQDVRLIGVEEPATVRLATAELANHQFLEDWSPAQRVCVGKGLTHAAARRGALGEAVERYSGAAWGERDVTHGRRGDLDGPSLDPRSLVLYRPEQYQRLPYAPYTDRARLGWVQARSLVSGARLFVPAIGVFLGYRPAGREEVLCPTTSNGLAAGATLADAVLAAAYEVLERDLFLVTWMNRLPAQRVDPREHPDRRLVRLCGDYRRCGVELELYRLTSDHPCHVFLALGIQHADGDGPAAAVGLGCDLDPSRAAYRAILEVGQARAGIRVRSPSLRARIDQLVADPCSVTTVQDHGLLYADRCRLPAFHFIRSSPPADVDWTAPDPPDTPVRLRRLVEHLASQGDDLLYVNCTPADMASLGLHTARVLIPGYQPLHFGAGEPRLAGRRLYELPYQLGLTPTPSTPEDLNVDPHPL